MQIYEDFANFAITMKKIVQNYDEIKCKYQ